MAGSEVTRLAAAVLLALAAVGMTAPASAHDSGLIVSADVEKKLSKKASVEGGVEFRSRNDFRTADRVAVGVGAEYKLARWLKADAGYQLLIDNNREKITYNYTGDGDFDGYNNWRPSYWGVRHRLNVSLTAGVKWNRVSLSLRERYRYTHRGCRTTERYDFDNGWWEDTDVAAADNHVLRSRVKAQWDIPKCKLTPWASVELFNSLSLDKTRCQLGADYTVKKSHTFSLYYRYQNVRHDDAQDPDTHHLGVGYKFKF